MKALFLVVVLAVPTGSAQSGKPCEVCVKAFTDAADANKCTAATTAATCLLAGTDATCTGQSANTAEKQLKDGTDTVYKVSQTKTCDPGITALCSCQGQYATKVASRTSSTSKETKCTEAKSYKTCVVGKDATMKACDGKTLQPAIKTEAEAKVTEFCPQENQNNQENQDNAGVSVVVGVKQFLLMFALALFQNCLKY